MATSDAQRVLIYTDGACLGNPGPGGFAALLVFGDKQIEVGGGFRLTTNNRMELTAVIAALRKIKAGVPITVYSDSKYVVDAMRLGWAKKWKGKGWMRTPTERAMNPDLWSQLLELCEGRDVTFEWVRGHSGHPENEACDAKSVAWANQKGLPADEGFEEARAAR
ncbi:MAG: ribonuclease HI [Fimbriimonadaceae bacterium]